MGELARDRRQLRNRLLVLRTALALAARSGREHQPPVAVVVPRGTDLAGINPADADHAADIINGQRRRSLDYQSPATLYAAATVQ